MQSIILKYCFIFSLIFCAQNINAQTNNYWSTELLNGFRLDSLGNFQLVRLPFNENILSGNASAISDNTGKPLLIRSSESFYNSKGELIGNGNAISRAWFTSSSNYLIQLDTSTYFVFALDSGYKGKSKCSYTIVKRDQNHTSGFSINENQKNITLYIDGFRSLGFCRNENSNIHMILRTRDYFTSYKLNIDGIIEKMDSFYYPETGLYPISLRLNPDLKLTPTTSILKMKNKGNGLVFSDYWSASTDKGLNSVKVYVSQSIKTLNYNKLNGSFYGLESIMEDTTSIFSPVQNESVIYNIAITPNDSVFCTFSQTNTIGFSAHFISHSILQYDLNTKSKRVIYNETDRNKIAGSSSGMAIDHLGRVFFSTTTPSKSRSFNIIKNPEKTNGDVGLKYNVFSIPSEFSYQYNYNRWSQHLFDYARVSVKIDYSCSAMVLIKNTSLKEGGFTNFTWFIEDEFGQINKYNQKDPPVLNYTKNGVYSYKLFATNAIANGYGEWYSDSIRILIPLKPIANFYVKDSQVCRFNEIEFINNSYAQSELKSTFLWKFGDGKTSALKSPKHIYEENGRYSVSLYYSNGYCDSTLIKHFYIEVLNSPKSGFEINKSEGCSPLELTITDTNKHYVSKRFYQFGDEPTVFEYPTSQTQIKYIYTKPGRFFVRQILHGFSNCIATSDSTLIQVFKGISKSDTSHLNNASVEGKQMNLIWNSMPGAVKYKVYSNGILISLVSDTFLNFDFDYIKSNKFEIVAIDKCENESSLGRFGMPVYLEGEVVGNNHIGSLKFSPYLQWKDSVKLYKIQCLVNSIWVTLSETNNNLRYEDLDFAYFGENGKFYRIEAVSMNGVISHSNTLYLKYIPQLYVPNSFSPNNDAFNEVFCFKTLGIKAYNYSILNQWGEIIHKGNNEHPNWSGIGSIQGVYVVLIEYITNDDEFKVYRGTLSVLK